MKVQPHKPICPICHTVSEFVITNTPYKECRYCGLWFQDPLPPKTYEADHEKDEHGGFRGHLMPDSEKEINNNLAKWLFTAYIKDAGSKVLDIGSKYPYLSHCLKNLGADAFGMDNIEIVPEYSKDLNVPMLMEDFESVPFEVIKKSADAENGFKLISLVHCFEHMYFPVLALHKLRKLVAEDGFVYIRSPDHAVTGYERDLTPGHFTIHPFFHAFSDILELLVQTKDLFTCDFYKPMDGAGQSDLILKPITRKPIVYAGLITKNEERDLPKCLESIKDVVDGVVIVDTGSVDKTEEVAKETWKDTNKPMYYSHYLEASEQDETGDWKLWNFGQARNQYVNKIEELDADYLLWMDSDDVLMTPATLKRAIYYSQIVVFGVRIDAGGPLWVHHRLWKTKVGIKYDFPIHEYPTMGGHVSITLKDVIIKHDAAPTFGENGNQRNLRILEREWTANPTSRVAFYLANTHNDGQRPEKAIEWYRTRISMGEHYKDEMLFAYLYGARDLRALKKPEEAKAMLLEGVAKAPNWSEFWSELSFVSYDQQKWQESIGYSLVALSQTNTYTQLWREDNKYTDQPARLISWCYENLGDRTGALNWAKTAKVFIGAPDADWDERINRLSKKRVAFVRPGAIGDVIMTLRLIPYFKKQNPEYEIHYFTSPHIGNGLKWLMQEVGVDEANDVSTFEGSRNSYDKVINLVGYPLAEGYPDKPMKRHLVEYFAAEMGLRDFAEKDWLTFVHKPSIPKEWDMKSKSYVTIQAKTGWSVYKEWPIERWEEAIKDIGLPVIQIGGADDPPVKGAIHSYLGHSLQDAIILFSNARFHLGVDSFTNHLSGFHWDKKKVPAIIVWGSTQPTASGYSNNNNISLGLWCSPCFREDPKVSAMSRGPCINPIGQTYDDPQHACMYGIEVEKVRQAIQQMLDYTK